MTLFRINNDILDIVLGYLWEGLRSKAFIEDLRVYKQWHDIVPARFLSAQIIYNGSWYHKVASPFRQYHPYVPRQNLLIAPVDIWNENLIILAASLCKERIRSIRTYKRCAIRWVEDCVWNAHPQYYKILYKKLLSRLTVDLFPDHVDKSLIRFLLDA